MSFEIADALVIKKADNTFAAKLSNGESATRWINRGGKTNDGRILIGENGHLVDVRLDPAKVAEFKEDVGNGVEDAHHRIVGEAYVDNSRFVAFFDKAGKSLSLKPAAASGETISIADEF